MSITSVAVYCGSSNAVDESFKAMARAVGTALAEAKIRVIYGGGHVGLMGTVADAALKDGNTVIGIIPEHIRALEVQHAGLTELHVVPDMHTRKRMMVERAEAFVILPGGLGTLDETFEILTWRQLKLHAKPILIFNFNRFWDPLLILIDRLIETHFCGPAHRDFYTVVHSVEEMMHALNAASPIPTAGVATDRI